jgi:plastocyanin
MPLQIRGDEMKKLIFLAVLSLSLSAQALAHQAFTLVSSEKKTIKLSELIAIEKERTLGTKGTTIEFTEKEIRLVIGTGPEDDMLSYRILGMRNPTLVVPSGATLRILFVNKDVDMRHDVRFGHVEGEFGLAPPIESTAGSTKLTAKSDDEVMQAEEIVIRATQDGLYKYFCSVRGHAKGGMWGNIAVGVKPGNLKPAPKTEHVHSPDEDHDDGATPAKPGQAKSAAKATPTPHDHAAEPAPKAPLTSHDGHAMPKKAEMAGMDHGEMAMASTVNIGDPMHREASGTSWAPDSSPMYARMKMYEDGGMLMLMGTAFLRYTDIGSSRDVSAAGDGSRSRVDAPTMFMAMYSRPVGERSQIGFRGMMSLDPIIQRGYGYPLLYQSGELYRGQPIHDRQHPHDLISELAVTFSHKIDSNKSFFVYAGYPGEPALGPPMYLHRASGMNNPDAPIGHHWQDATHITWGVVTGGFSFGKAKIEASVFKGEEPDENRYNFDRPRFDSFSGRFSVNPTKNLSLQISHGYLKNPEPAEPEVRILRKTTASAIYNKRFGEDRNWASTFVWGQNYANGERTNAFLFESNYDLYKNAVFGRLETVEKSGHELVLDHPLDHDVFRVNAFSIGYIRDLVQNRGFDLGLGTMVTINKNPRELAPVYGGTTHGGWQVFLRLRPSKLLH